MSIALGLMRGSFDRHKRIKSQISSRHSSPGIGFRFGPLYSRGLLCYQLPQYVTEGGNIRLQIIRVSPQNLWRNINRVPSIESAKIFLFRPVLINYSAVTSFQLCCRPGFWSGTRTVQSLWAELGILIERKKFDSIKLIIIMLKIVNV